MFFRQCDAAPSDLAADCAPAYRISAPSESNGRGATYLPVTQGEIAAQGAGSFFCDEQHACSLAALTDPTDLSTAVFAALTFAPSADACPDPGDAAILGGGSSTAGLAFDSWSAIVCQPPSSLPIGYSVSNSPNGRLQYIAGNYWFAGTATPFSYDQQVQLYEAKRGYGYAPVASSGLVLASNIHEQNTDRGEAGPLITDLKLTPADVARIFTGQVDNWHLDRRINNLNPTHKGKFPPLVQPMVRGDNSASTYLFTSWLSAVAPEELPATWPGPTESFPVGDYLSPSNGKETAQALALSIAAPEEIDLFQFGYIGYVDSSMASYYGLAPVKIKNAAGKFVEATPEALAAGVRHMKTNPDGTTATPDFQTKDPKAYPLPVVSYLVAPTNKADEGKAGTDGRVHPLGRLDRPAGRGAARGLPAAADNAAQTGERGGGHGRGPERQTRGARRTRRPRRSRRPGSTRRRPQRHHHTDDAGHPDDDALRLTRAHVVRQPFSVGGPLSIRIAVGLGVAQGLRITVGVRIAHGERHTVRVSHALGRSVRGRRDRARPAGVPGDLVERRRSDRALPGRAGSPRHRGRSRHPGVGERLRSGERGPPPPREVPSLMQQTESSPRTVTPTPPPNPSKPRLLPLLRPAACGCPSTCRASTRARSCVPVSAWWWSPSSCWRCSRRSCSAPRTWNRRAPKPPCSRNSPRSCPRARSARSIRPSRWGIPWPCSKCRTWVCGR